MPLPEERGGGALRRRPMCVARGKVRGIRWLSRRQGDGCRPPMDRKREGERARREE